MADKVTNLNIERANKENDNTLVTPRDVFEDCIDEIDSGECPFDYESVIVLKITKMNGDYGLSFSLGNLKMSEMIGALEIGKQLALNQMGYNLMPENFGYEE